MCQTNVLVDYPSTFAVFSSLLVLHYREDNQSLTDDYERITEQYRELQKKFRWEIFAMNANRTPIPHADVTKKIVRFSYNGNKRPCVQPRSKKHPGTEVAMCQGWFKLSKFLLS